MAVGPDRIDGRVRVAHAHLTTGEDQHADGQQHGPEWFALDVRHRVQRRVRHEHPQVEVERAVRVLLDETDRLVDDEPGGPRPEVLQAGLREPRAVREGRPVVIDPVATLDLEVGARSVRPLVLFGSLCGVALYVLIVAGLYKNMVRNFDMTVRKQLV